MSQPACESCTDLRNYAPEFVQGGVTSNVAASLKNNTGLTASLAVTHKNCEDLQDVNDCLIGRKIQEIEQLDVCDWKNYMSGFGQNLYETLKAIIMSDCGEWTNIENLRQRITEVCALIDRILRPGTSPYGVLPTEFGTLHPSHKGGRLEPVGNPLLELYNSPTEESVYKNACVGLKLAFQRNVGCANLGNLMWYMPELQSHRFTRTPSDDDALWSVSRAEAAAWGVPDNFWATYTNDTWKWLTLWQHASGGDSLGYVRLKVNSETNRLELRFSGVLGGGSVVAGTIPRTFSYTERVTGF